MSRHEGGPRPALGIAIANQPLTEFCLEGFAEHVCRAGGGKAATTVPEKTRSRDYFLFADNSL